MSECPSTRVLTYCCSLYLTGIRAHPPLFERRRGDGLGHAVHDGTQRRLAVHTLVCAVGCAIYGRPCSGTDACSDIDGCRSDRSDRNDRGGDKGDRGERTRDRSSERGRKSKQDSSNPGNNLYITGLSTRVNEKDLEEHFSREGKVCVSSRLSVMTGS